MRSVEKKHRRFLAAMLTLCLLLGLCPLTPSAQAEETTTTTVAGSTTIEDAQSVPVGVPVTTTLNTGKNYYAIPDVKVGQQIGVELDKRYNGVSTWVYKANGDTMIGESWVADANGTYYLSISAQTQTTVTFTITLYDNDEHEPNDTIETATPIEPDKQVDAVLFGDDIDFFAITTTKANQYIALDISGQRGAINAQLYDRMGGVQKAYGNSPDSETTEYVFCTAEAGTYYLKFFTYSSRAFFSFTASLLDNDTNEPNDTKATATELHDGESTEFTVAGSDIDYFKVVTTKPGQDIALTVSGYNYANQGERFYLYFDPAGDLKYNNTSCAAYAEIDANRTLYLHAAAAGEHYIALQRSDTTPLTRTLSVEILDGDANEQNDTRETATPLTVGTDAAFMVGGFGDEDWFSFEAAPNAGEKKLYTLSFLDLNTDYSDEFFYEVYAPDGTPVVGSTRVNIRHVNTIGCDQQGQYLVRVHTTAAKGTYYFASVDGSYNGRAMDYKRSALRICVSEGGDDPYESNDTWLIAANVPVGNIQHVLASTADTDWFCFTVPEDDMTLHLTSTKRTNAVLYRAETLMEYGEDNSKGEFGSGYNSSRTVTDMYFKLTDAGIYYIKLTADSSYIDHDIRTTGIELLTATDEENNDTWKKATPLYEGAPRSFEISAGNDVDWFKLVVPKRGARVGIRAAAQNRINYSLYREEDFLTAGDNAARIDDWYGYSAVRTLTLDAGAYYLKAKADGRCENCSVVYNILPPSEENVSLETAKPLAPGEWAEYYRDTNVSDEYRYFCIGERKAGEVVRVSRDAVGSWCDVDLLDAAGKTVKSDGYANQTFRIPADGRYYLKTQVFWEQDNNGRPRLNRLRYDVGSGTESVNAIKSVDSLTLLEGEKMFLDLRCAPYGAMSSGSGYSFNTETPTCVEYSGGSGYLTAQSAGTGTLTVSLNGDSSVKKEIPVTVLAKDSLSASDVSISGAPETLPLGASADLTANYTLAGGAMLTNSQKVVTWTSSDPKVIYVSPGGKVTAVGGGTATVTASVGGVSEESAPITVTAAAETPQETVSSIKLNKYSLTLYMNEEGEQLTATIQPASFAKSIVWNSSDTKVASVSDSGLVTAVGPGTCIISATAGDRHVSATVSVLAARVRVTGVSFGETKHEIPVRGTAKLTATIAPADATVKTLVWTSDDPGIASVSRTGIVTAVSVGTTKIHATSVDGNHSAEITVTVTAAPQLGDVNGDGYIDSADAMLCLRSAVGLKKLTEEQKSAADVNKDGFVDAGDAIKILRYDAKLIDSLN